MKWRFGPSGTSVDVLVSGSSKASAIVAFTAIVAIAGLGRPATGDAYSIAGDSLTMCRRSAEDPSVEYTILVDVPAVLAHLAQGDRIGRCEGRPGGGDHDDDSDTDYAASEDSDGDSDTDADSDSAGDSDTDGGDASEQDPDGTETGDSDGDGDGTGDGTGGRTPCDVADTCDDGVGCTEDECLDGFCAYRPIDAQCGDQDVCNGDERCDPIFGCREGAPLDDAVACDDGDPVCTPRDICLAGRCFGVPLCHPVCELCEVDGDGRASCSSLCANPHRAVSTSINATDSLFTLRAAIDLESCPLCVCDVNASGATTATDSLSTLLYLVGLPMELRCPTPEPMDDGMSPPTTAP